MPATSRSRPTCEHPFGNIFRNCACDPDSLRVSLPTSHTLPQHTKRKWRQKRQCPPPAQIPSTIPAKSPATFRQCSGNEALMQHTPQSEPRCGAKPHDKPIHPESNPAKSRPSLDRQPRLAASRALAAKNRQHSGNIPATFRQHSGNISAHQPSHLRPMPVHASGLCGGPQAANRLPGTGCGFNRPLPLAGKTARHPPATFRQHLRLPPQSSPHGPFP